MHGIKRVIVFCTLTTILPTVFLVIPLYLRHSFYANVVYAVTESDILEITDGISTIFCSAHTLQMNETFNAFQMAQKPEITSYRKHIRLKKSMNLPDDTLEYWGFYLLKGATVALSVCSRFEGASILVVKGERNLRTCGLLEHNNDKQIVEGIFLPEANRQVKITFESNAQEINSKEFDRNILSNGKANDVLGKNTVSKHKLSISSLDEIKRNTSNIDTNKNDTKSDKENVQDKELEELVQTARSYAQKHVKFVSLNDSKNNTRKLRHAKKRHHKKRTEEQTNHRQVKERKKKRKNAVEDKTSVNMHIKDEHDDPIQSLKTELHSKVINDESIEDEEERENKMIYKRLKRSQELVKPPSLLDQGIKHGGNAIRNITDTNEVSSVSSFENGLFNCYGGSILLAQEFAPSEQCVNVSYLLSSKHMQTRHNVVEDGYYYYIFYSDNDIVSNDIHALFDIYKPTFQYENVTKSCINQTECSFSLSLLSPDRVIVEIPTRDGIEHEKDDVNLLVSICHPRMGIYIIFPIAVLLLILTCAFM